METPNTPSASIKKIGDILLHNKYALLGILLFACLLIYISYRIYKSQVEPGLKYESPEQGGNSNIAQVYYFYTQWCPHCKNATTVWDEFTNMYDKKTIKNYVISCTSVDCDSDETTADQYNVESYPTIKLVKDGTVYEYDAKPNIETLGEFLNSVL